MARKGVIDGKDVPIISAYFEDSEDTGEPNELQENANSVFQGSIFLGDGFLLTHAEAEELIKTDNHNKEIIFPVINGQELNNNPKQNPGRSIINFFNWELEKAQRYGLPFQIIEQNVKTERMKQKDKGGQEYWWLFLRPRIERLFQIFIH